MYATRISLSSKLPLTKPVSAQLSRVVAAHSAFPTCTASARQHASVTTPSPRREFSSTSRASLREYFPEPEHNHAIRRTGSAWPHPEFSATDMQKKIFFAHRDPKDFSDRFALFMVRLLRWGTDLATGYKHNVESPKTVSDSNAVAGTKAYGMSESKWLVRFIFLESVAGVPGMVAGMLRHLHSLRRMKRDNGWIETLLEEAYNERMHLLTFLKMAEPGWFMRFMILGAQGVFFNGMFLSYLVSPRTCHRFVGYLEEEAVLTYTLAIQDVESGKLPKWSDPNFRVPDLAVNYWNMPEGSRTMRDLLLYIRADEAKHREVNHTLGNLDQKVDPNPFVSSYKDETKAHPSKGIEHTKPTGWEREDVI
ncbi:putative alternative oxidase [Coleophoma crateriformis]|uniref:Alternative oxidase n=1 Tax=Coleophoma crateriformis TaxID=565419 RepID=A0A3D8RWJ9_9HELO|nr:putative alternative oxidase [Coleophoma crateriformis]